MIRYILKDHFWGYMDDEFEESNINGGDFQFWLGIFMRNFSCRNMHETTTFTLTIRKKPGRPQNQSYI